MLLRALATWFLDVSFQVTFFQTVLISESEADAGSFGAWNCFLAGQVPPFRQLGGTLGGQGISRRDTAGSRVGLLEIFGGFRHSILKVLPTAWNTSGVFFYACSVFVFVDDNLG